MMESNIYFDQAFSISTAYNMQDYDEKYIDFCFIRSKYFILTSRRWLSWLGHDI
jgi:hypothetical protein